MELNQGKVFIISAPSGAGKTTLSNRLLEHFPSFEFSVSATTRPPRHYEKDGIHYYFLTEEAFRLRVENDEFLEWEEVYEGRFYGTLKAEVDRILSLGRNPVFDVDVVGGLNIKKQYGDQAVSIFISPPSLEALKERLINRKSDSEAEIEKRLKKAGYEMSFRDKFDHVIINDDLDKATTELFSLVRQYLKINHT